MKLAGLSIKGFKSFADRTEIEFPEGITMIVGPNGSGKSNISDALRWVLGETSLKNIRGEKMEDVIYQGSKNRSPLGFAEVEVVLDNSDNFLPIEYKEVSIARKYYRSGESIYMINRTECRAKDIRDLLLDTGVGKDGYSIIGQGRIDNILSEKPEDRRAVFEEVAGIAKFRTGKVEAERKLTRATDNLTRIEDILYELNNSYEAIKIEAEKTRIYQQTFQEMKSIDLNLSKSEYEKLVIKRDEVISTLKEREGEISQKEAELLQLQGDYEEKKKALSIAREDEKKISEERDILREHREEISKLLSIKENEIGFAEREKKRLNEEILKHISQISNLKEQLEVFEKSLSDTEISYRDEEGIYKEYEDKLSSLSPLIEKKSAEENLLREDLIKSGKNLQSLREKINFSNIALEEYGTKKEVFEREISKRSENLEILENSIKNLNKKNKDVVIAIEREQKINSDNLKKLGDGGREKDELFREKHKIELINQSFKSELSAIKKMEEGYEGYKRPVKFLMSLKDRRDRGILGTLSELFSVDKKFQLAIETALGGQLQNIVVNEDKDAEKLIELLKRERAGRITFLPLNRINGRNQTAGKNILNTPGVFGIAVNLIEFDNMYSNIFSDLLGATLVLDNLKTALELPKQDIKYFKIVTLEGEVISSRGAITGGIEGDKQIGLLSRRNKISELEEKISGKITEIEDIDERISLKEKVISEIRLNIADSNNRLEKLKKDNEEDLMSENKLIVQRKSEEDLLRLKKEELKSLLDSEKDLKSKIIVLKNEIEDETLKETSLKKSLENLQSSMGEESGKVRDITDRKNECVIKLENLKNRIDRLREDNLRLNKNLSDEENEKTEMEQALETCEAYFNETREIIEKNKETLKALNKEFEEKEEERGILKERNESLLQNVYEIQKLIENNSDYRNSFEKKTSELKVKETKFEMQRENLRERILSDYGEDIETVKPENFEESVKILRERLDELKEKIANSDQINPNAIEEERKLKERLELMVSQRDDLIKGKADLSLLISEIEAKMSEEFKKSMQNITLNFDMIFQKFFGGGSANVSLSDNDNPLTSGIDIVVNLPDKRRQSISLLSGGERALTAIALLFAIQRIKPTPFCILDEIDAALDDANIERFTKYLENSLDNIQFILVTHRKKTMEIANTIYGVTMDDDGVSKLLSMKLEDANYKGVR